MPVKIRDLRLLLRPDEIQLTLIKHGTDRPNGWIITLYPLAGEWRWECWWHGLLQQTGRAGNCDGAKYAAEQWLLDWHVNVIRYRQE